MRKQLEFVAATVLLAVLAGCSASIGKQVESIPRSTGEPGSAMAKPVVEYPILGSAPADLRAVDWASTPLPGEFCGVPGVVVFTGGLMSSPTNGEVELRVDPSGVKYGDLDGDAHDEAAIPVSCANGGGTAAGQIAFAYVIATTSDGALRSMATISPQETLDDAAHVTLLDGLRIEDRRVVVEEYFYRASDMTCCPTGTALTTWTYRDGQVVPGAPAIGTLAPTEIGARQALTDFLAAWRRGDTAGMARLADAEAISQFTEDPAGWADDQVNWTSDCEPDTSGRGSCGLVFISQEGGGVTWIASYQRADRRFRITSFQWLGGGA